MSIANEKWLVEHLKIKSFLSFFKESTLNQVFDLAILLGKMVDVFHIFTALRFVVKNFS